MKRQNINTACVLLLLFIVFANADYKIVWSTIDGGGGISSGGPYELSGTIGQPDPGYHYGGDYELLGGYQVGGPLCFVTFEDFANFAAQWADTGPGLEADLSGNNSVGIEDLEMLCQQWLLDCPYAWPLK